MCQIVIQGEETTYILKYPEMRQSVSGKVQWSIRQTGIYQGFNTLTLQITWFFLLPNREPAVESDLIHKLHGSELLEESKPHPLSLHIYIFRARMNSWRQFIAHFEERVWILVGSTFLQLLNMFTEIKYRQISPSQLILKKACRLKKHTKIFQISTI
jgi:hypothetical protein